MGQNRLIQCTVDELRQCPAVNYIQSCSYDCVCSEYNLSLTPTSCSGDEVFVEYKIEFWDRTMSCYSCVSCNCTDLGWQKGCGKGEVVIDTLNFQCPNCVTTLQCVKCGPPVPPNPCQGSLDPCCGSTDPHCCDESQDPCCGKSSFECNSCLGSSDPECNPCAANPDSEACNPCFGSTDPCCGSTDPCCGSDDPCCGSDDPCCGSSDPCCGITDPCCPDYAPCCVNPTPECDHGCNSDEHGLCCEYPDACFCGDGGIDGCPPDCVGGQTGNGGIDNIDPCL